MVCPNSMYNYAGGVFNRVIEAFKKKDMDTAKMEMVRLPVVTLGCKQRPSGANSALLEELLISSHSKWSGPGSSMPE